MGNMVELVQAVEGRMVEINLSNNVVTEQSTQQQCGDSEQNSNNNQYLAKRTKSMRVRYVYGIIFLITNFVAWFFRDYGEGVRPLLHYSKACSNGHTGCLHALGVLRVSLGCFIFFVLMFLSTLGTKKLDEVRNTWHSEWWTLKFIMLIISFFIPFFIPPEYIRIYGEVARIGAGIFLLLQLISVIEFITWWNNYWMSEKHQKYSCCVGLFMSTICYVASIFGVLLMYVFYASNMSCTLNIFFITWTGILLTVMMIITLHSKVNRGLLSSGIMASYIVFLCWTAIRSEPATAKCSPQNQDSSSDHSSLITVIGFLIAVFAVVMATFSTGIDSQTFQFRQNKIQLEDDLPYMYGFFHLVFSLGAMYFAMLLISWDPDSLARKWSIDVGWTSTWVKIVNEWFAATLYLWKLISPIVTETKVMHHEEIEQVQEQEV